MDESFSFPQFNCSLHVQPLTSSSRWHLQAVFDQEEVIFITWHSLYSEQQLWLYDSRNCTFMHEQRASHCLFKAANRLTVPIKGEVARRIVQKKLVHDTSGGLLVLPAVSFRLYTVTTRWISISSELENFIVSDVVTMLLRDQIREKC